MFKFCIPCSRRRTLIRESSLLAAESWQLICDIAAVYTFARRSKADEFVHNCLQKGLGHAAQYFLRSGKTDGYKHGRKRMQKRAQLANDEFAQFFLTEFDNNNGDNWECGSADSEGSDEDEDDDSPLGGEGHSQNNAASFKGSNNYGGKR